MTAVLTNADFADFLWHDNALYGVRLDPADPEAGDWRSDLHLSIDHIVEWLRAPDGDARFRVAPALLTFHDVAGLSIRVDWNGETLHDMSIHTIAREPGPHPSDNPDLDRYRWRIDLNWPGNGMIEFEASGFTQRLLAAPVDTIEQTLSPARRQSLLPSNGR